MERNITEERNEIRLDAVGKYASVNGLKLYYEIYGAGTPLILLHGGLGVTAMFAEILPLLAETRQVIAVELQAHGHTADIDRPLSYELMADDTAALIKHLGYERADVCGYSLGGGVALQTAIRHPEVVRKLVLLSTTFKRDGWYPEVLVGMASMNAEVAMTWVGSPMHDAYAGASPRPEDWPQLVDKLSQLLRKNYDWSEQVAGMKTPTLIIAGDADGFPPQHAVDMFGLLGGGKADIQVAGRPGSQLAVLPGTTHFSILLSPELLLPIIQPFLDAPLPEDK